MLAVSLVKTGDVAGFTVAGYLQRGFIFSSRRFPFVPRFSRLYHFLPLVYVARHHEMPYCLDHEYGNNQ